MGDVNLKAQLSGVLLVDKAAGKTSFQIVHLLRKITNVQKIGHAGTLDPFATGVMVLLIGSNYTKRSEEFIQSDKQYIATIHLGISTDTYDIDGQITETKDTLPSLDQIEAALHSFQGEISQTPPMFSAKKVKGQKLYHLARQGKTIERAPQKVTVHTKLISYDAPYLKLQIDCSKGTYIRSIAYELGQTLSCGAHLSSLVRTKSGPFTVDQCISQENIQHINDILPHLRTL
jgi:tRNA pseudouridine55 synthase